MVEPVRWMPPEGAPEPEQATLVADGEVRSGLFFPAPLDQYLAQFVIRSQRASETQADEMRLVLDALDEREAQLLAVQDALPWWTWAAIGAAAGALAGVSVGLGAR